MNDLDLFLSETNENFKYVKVVFKYGNDITYSKFYTYKTFLDFEINDLAIVKVNQEFKVVKVVDVFSYEDLDVDYSINWIVSKLDTSNYENYVEMSKEVVKKLNKLKFEKRKKELMSELTECIGEDNIKEVKKLIRL